MQWRGAGGGLGTWWQGRWRGKTRTFTAPDQVCSVLVYRDNVAPDWSVTVDGTSAELLVVDGLNKAVAVSPGEHSVEFRYRPWAYLVAFALRALALLFAVAACVWLAIRAFAKPRAT